MTPDDPLIAALRRLLAEDELSTDRDVIRTYSQDHSERPLPGAARALVRPRTTEEIQAVMRTATEHRTPVIVRGAGSGLSGGSTAIDGCLILALDRMRDIDIDAQTHVARVQPGALNADVKAAAASHGLWYPPDPASYEFCSIGGNVATNAGGLCCVKYGVTGDYVLGMTVVLADGRKAVLGGDRVKDVAGLSLTKLFVGSEGTLGIITEILLRLIPTPTRPLSLIATFPELPPAMAAVAAITSSLRPSMLEFMDRTTINAVEDMTHMGLDRDAAAMLIIQSDAPGQQARTELDTIADICRSRHATDCVVTDDPDDSEAFVTARRIAVTAVEKKGAMLLEDAGVPVPRLGNLAQGIGDISTTHEVPIALIAHAGDGNTHPMILFDRADPASIERANKAFADVMALTISLGGTITGEHGVGRLKQPWLADQVGPEVMNLTRTIEDALDPDGILNPGTILTANVHRP